MKKLFAILASVFTFCSLSSAETFQKDESFTCFNAIEASNTFQVSVKRGSDYYVHLVIDKRVENYYTVFLNGGTLVLGIKEKEYTKDVVKNLFKQKDTSPLVLMATVYIPQDAEINEICLEDSAILTCDTPLRTKQNFKIETTETSSVKGLEIVSSSLTVKTEKKSSVIAEADSPEISINTKNSSIADLTVKAKNVNVESDNFSQLTLSGATTEARLRSSGSSKLAVKTTTENFFVSAKGSSVIDATEGVITNAEVELTGADCMVNPLKTLTLSVASNAELVFDGTPVITIKKITNSTVIPASEVKKKK